MSRAWVPTWMVTIADRFANGKRLCRKLIGPPAGSSTPLRPALSCVRSDLSSRPPPLHDEDVTFMSRAKHRLQEHQRQIPSSVASTLYTSATSYNTLLCC